jgi:hypothetical protein
MKGNACRLLVGKYVGNRRYGRREGRWESVLKWTTTSMIRKVLARFFGLRIGKWSVCTLRCLKMRDIFGLNEQLLKASQQGLNGKKKWFSWTKIW